MVGWLIKNLLQGVQWHSYFILVQFLFFSTLIRFPSLKYIRDMFLSRTNLLSIEKYPCFPSLNTALSPVLNRIGILGSPLFMAASISNLRLNKIIKYLPSQLYY